MPRYESPYDPSTMPKHLEHVIYEKKGHVAYVRRLTAEECYRQAIVNKVVPRDKLMATCEEMADMICDSSPLAVQAAVRLYRLAAAFEPSLVSLRPPARSGDRRERGRRRGPARLPRQAQARVEAAVSDR